MELLIEICGAGSLLFEQREYFGAFYVAQFVLYVIPQNGLLFLVGHILSVCCGCCHSTVRRSFV